MQRANKIVKPEAGTARRLAAVDRAATAGGFHDSPRMTAQRRQLRSIFGAPSAVRQYRAEDPHELGAVHSPQVHHIIAHSKLKGGMDKLDPGDQGDVKRAFMPGLGSLTIRQLLNINDRLEATTTSDQFGVQDRKAKKTDIYPEMTWIDVPLGTLDDSKITLHNPAVGFQNTPLAVWKASYNLVQLGQEPVVGSKDAFWSPLQDAYAEWSGGNLFYGAQKRVEPGGADFDAFDSDAKYFRDPQHVEKLQALALRLSGAGDDTGAIKTVLLEIAALCKDAGPGPKNDRAQWFSAKTDDQKALIIGLLEPGPRKDFLGSQGEYSYLPIEYVIERIEAHTRLTEGQTHDVLGYLRSNGYLPVIENLTFRRTQAKQGTKIHVGGTNGVDEIPISDRPRQTMSTLGDLLKGQLQAVANKLKTALGI